MDTAFSISPEEFAITLGHAGAPLVLDVRHEERFLQSERMLPGARRCPPDQIARFAAGSGHHWNPDRLKGARQ